MNRAERALFTTLALFAAGVVTVQGAPRVPGHPRKPPRLPRAVAIPLQLGDVVTVNGATYQIQLAPALMLLSPAPLPIPTPTPKPALTGIRNRLTGLLVTAARAGDPLSLEGTLLGTGAGRVQLAGRIAAQPTSWTQTAIQFLAPDPGPTAVTGGWDVYQPSGNTYAIIASSGSFTLLPAGTPIPTPIPSNSSLTVTGFRDAMGVVTNTFAPGSTVFIQGQGFGTATGRVSVGVDAVPVLQWTPTQIQVKAPLLALGPIMLTVTSADGKQYERLKGFSITGAGKVKF